MPNTNATEQARFNQIKSAALAIAWQYQNAGGLSRGWYSSNSSRFLTNLQNVQNIHQYRNLMLTAATTYANDAGLSAVISQINANTASLEAAFAAADNPANQ